MKRIFTLAAFLLFLGQTAFAQLPDGSIAPDFTATDINGVEHNLYELLDQGKSVVLDVSATWCPPCWSYHQSGVLEELWEEHGPDGADDIYVFMIEGDASTTQADLEGTGSNTAGDWITGTGYPIIDNAGIANAYQIAYFPTLYHICPNRLVTEIGQVPNVSNYVDASGQCLAASGANNGGILAYTGFEGTICGDVAVVPSFQFQNLGSDTITTASFNLTLNGEIAETMMWEGELSTFGITEVSFAEVSLSETTDVEISVVSINGTDDEDASNDVVVASIATGAETSFQVLTVELLTDNYGYETYWEVTNEMGEVLAFGGNEIVGPNGGGLRVANPADPTAYGNNELVTQEVIVPASGCYFMKVVDDYGDGICCSYGEGYFRLSDPDGNILAQGGNFANEVEEVINANLTTSTTTLDAVSQLNIFPNPTSANATINFTLAEAMQLRVDVVNTLGQKVQTIAVEQFAAGRHSFDLNTTNLTNGLYYLNVRSADKQITRKFAVSR